MTRQSLPPERTRLRDERVYSAPPAGGEGRHSFRTRSLAAMVLLAATACSLAACDGWGTGLGRRAGTPKAIGRLPAITIKLATGVAVAPLFVDPNGDSLTLTVESNPPGVLGTQVSGSFVELFPGEAALVEVLVTATDPTGRTDDLGFRVKVREVPIPIISEFGRLPRPPRRWLQFPSRQLLLGELATIPLDRLFRAPPSTMFTVTSSSGAVQASIAEDSLVLQARSLGPSEIVVTASNDITPSPHPVQHVFDVVVDPPGTPPNHPPWAFGTSRRVIPVGFTVPYDVAEFFSDPEDRPLTFTATSDAPNKAAVSVSGSDVFLQANRSGEAVITLVATDHGGLPVRTPLRVSVIEWGDDR